jgi:hypothetical protein
MPPHLIRYLLYLVLIALHRVIFLASSGILLEHLTQMLLIWGVNNRNDGYLPIV